MTELELRIAATSATFDRFNGVAFDLGKDDCAHMLAFHLRRFPLIKVPSLLKVGSYKTEAGARRALMRLGVSSLSEIMDQYFPRIAPAEARTGDILCGPGDGRTGDAMAIRLHRNNALGFLDGACGEVIIHDYVAAWRIV